MPRSSVRAAIVLALALAACSPSTSPGGGPPPPPSCALAPAASLVLLEVTPVMFATGVSVNTPVVLRFGTCLDLRTLGGITFTGPSGAVPFTTSYDGATSTLTLHPSAPLAYAREYDVMMSSALRGASGEQIGAALLLATTFTTRSAPESIPPVTTASPPAGRYNHAIAVTLSCADNVGGVGCAGTYFTLDGSVPGPASARYAAPIPIAADTTVRFASVDLDGNWESPRTASYVIDVDPPDVVGVSPLDGASGVPLDASIAVTFDEAMDVSSLYNALTAVPRVDKGPSYDGATFTVTYRPDRPLDCATTYALTLSGAKDLAGNAIVAPKQWTFTTSSDCTPPRTTASPQGGSFATAPQSVTLTCDDGTGTGCARVVYTTDGTVPTLTNGTVVTGSSAGPIAVAQGETVLRFFAVDQAGNREPMREERYAVSTSGFTYVATTAGIARGAGPVPDRFYTRTSLGDTSAFFRDPSSGRLWRATSQSVVFSDDGVTWTACPKITYGTSTTLVPVSAVWARGSLVLAGTREGLFGSVDGGMTWSVWLRQMIDYYTVAEIVDIDGRDKDVFVATSRGLAMSHDSGRSWTWLNYGTLFYDVAFDAATGQLYAASTAGLVVSGDKGATHSTFGTASTPALPSDDVRGVAFTADRIHVATAAGYVRMDRGAGGLPTSAAVTAVPCGGDTSVLRVAASPTKVFLVTGQWYLSGSTSSFCISADGGGSFAPGWFRSPRETTAIARAVHVEADSVYVGYPPGWYLSTDGGATFAQKDFQGAVDVAASGGKVFAATGDGLVVSDDGFRSFVVRTRRDGLYDDDVNRVAASGSSVYAATSWKLAVSTDGGTTFTIPSFSFVNTPDAVAADGATVFAGFGTILYRSSNGGTSWTQVLPPVGQTGYLGDTPGVAVRGTRVALGDWSTVWVSNDTGASFVERTDADGLVPYPGGSLQIQDVDVDGAGAIWVASSSGAYVSTDGGVTFGRPAAANLPANVWIHGVEARPGAPVYLDTNDGLAITTDGGATVTWRKDAEGIQGARASVYVP